MHPFPDTPEIMGTWWPIYWTPLAGSGERLTAFVVARENVGPVYVHRTFSPELLITLFPSHAASLETWFQQIQQSIEAHLLTRSKLESWESPISCFQAGSRRSSTARTARAIAKEGGKMESSFFSAVPAS